MMSKSYTGDHFYRYPRIDYLLKKHSEGVIAASRQHLGGVYAGDFWQNREREARMQCLMQCARLRKKCNRFLEIDGMAGTAVEQRAGAAYVKSVYHPDALRVWY